MSYTTVAISNIALMGFIYCFFLFCLRRAPLIEHPPALFRKGFIGIAFVALLMALMGVCIQISLSEIFTFVLSFFEGASEKYDEVISPLISAEPSMIIYVGVLAPVFEELAFRGLIFLLIRWFMFAVARAITRDRNVSDGGAFTDSSLPDVYRRIIHGPIGFFANVFQALCFGLYHGNIYQGSYAFVIGLLFGEICLLSGSVIPGMVAHSFVNLSGIYLESFVTDIDRFISPVFAVTGLLIMAWVMWRIKRMFHYEQRPFGL